MVAAITLCVYGHHQRYDKAVKYTICGSITDTTVLDLSTGPTSLIGLLTSHGVDDLKKEYSPSAIASAMALMVSKVFEKLCRWEKPSHQTSFMTRKFY